jgi:hypothetical protein
MAWTYGPATFPQPDALSELDQVRLLLGDTNPSAPLLQDEEIGLFLSTGLQPQASPLLSAAMAAALLASRYRRLVDIREGAASASLSQLAKQFTDLASELRSQASLGGGSSGLLPAMSCGGGQRAFTRTMGDEPGAGDWPS